MDNKCSLCDRLKSLYINCILRCTAYTPYNISLIFRNNAKKKERFGARNCLVYFQFIKLYRLPYGDI